MITIEQQGQQWIASDGTNHAEGFDPIDAVLGLEIILDGGGEVPEDSFGSMDRIGEQCFLLIKLLYAGAPMSALGLTVESINHAWEDYRELQQDA